MPERALHHGRNLLATIAVLDEYRWSGGICLVSVAPTKQRNYYWIKIQAFRGEAIFVTRTVARFLVWCGYEYSTGYEGI